MTRSPLHPTPDGAAGGPTDETLEAREARLQAQVAALEGKARALAIADAVRACGGDRVVRNVELVTRLIGTDPRLQMDPADAARPRNVEPVLRQLLREYPYLARPGPLPPALTEPAAPISATPRPPRSWRAN